MVQRFQTFCCVKWFTNSDEDISNANIKSTFSSDQMTRRKRKKMRNGNRFASEFCRTLACEVGFPSRWVIGLQNINADNRLRYDALPNAQTFYTIYRIIYCSSVACIFRIISRCCRKTGKFFAANCFASASASDSA